MFKFDSIQASPDDIVGQLKLFNEDLECKYLFKGKNNFDLYHFLTDTFYYVSYTKVGLEIYKFHQGARRPVYVKKTDLDDIDVDNDDNDEYYGSYKNDKFEMKLVNYLKEGNPFTKKECC